MTEAVHHLYISSGVLDHYYETLINIAIPVLRLHNHSIDLAKPQIGVQVEPVRAGF